MTRSVIPDKMKHYILYFLALLLLAYGCSPCEFKEIERIKSPDGIVDVVHVRGDCGATTSFSENVFIVQNGAETPAPKERYQVFSADHIEGLKLIWRESKVLEIHYKEARIFHFTNFWHSKNVQNFSYVVEIRLRPQAEDYSLSRRDRWLDMK